jgi:hypothetical protein
VWCIDEKCCEIAWDHVSASREGYIEIEEVWCDALRDMEKLSG